MSSAGLTGSYILKGMSENDATNVYNRRQRSGS
jgi:hypothetical protein